MGFSSCYMTDFPRSEKKTFKCVILKGIFTNVILSQILDAISKTSGLKNH